MNLSHATRRRWNPCKSQDPFERVKYLKEKVQQHPDMFKFKCRVNDEYEELVAYNDNVDYIEQDQTWNGTWKFRKIFDHQGPIKSSYKERYKVSRYNVQVECETGEITWAPLTTKEKMRVQT
ncbi:hypothetical protein SEMRO_3492_G348590.1 [Seminavis robusta]|uniref:Uncharacterized protein n=1 Tax=Seminavis robusta TaxID=568900 RepID=A0A9N8F438_9STRA|nr:hypothetical protein SEMRO_3492_G348590.1 [Seminavis robusta]|eukprot:Sro3492_g348590.1 n/a (122) ;mRNA; f:730-1095